MHWLIYTTIAVLSRAIYGVMTKVMSSKIKTSVFTQSVLLPLCGGLITFFVSPILGGINIQINSSNIALILVVAVSQGLGNLFYFIGMKSLTSGAAQISFSSILIFNTILPILFLKLQLSFINILGVVLLMIAILSAINGDLEFNTKGVAFMTLSAFFFAIYQLSASILSTFVTAAEYMLIAYLGASIIILLIKGRLFIRDIINLKNKKNTIIITFLTCIPGFFTLIFVYYAYLYAPKPAKVAMLLTSQVVFAILLSYFFLKEKHNLLRKLFAAVLVIISAIMIKL